MSKFISGKVSKMETRVRYVQNELKLVVKSNGTKWNYTNRDKNEIFVAQKNISSLRVRVELMVQSGQIVQKKQNLKVLSQQEKFSSTYRKMDNSLVAENGASKFKTKTVTEQLQTIRTAKALDVKSKIMLAKKLNVKPKVELVIKEELFDPNLVIKKEKEDDTLASNHGMTTTTQHVGSIWSEEMEDIKPKIEAVVKQRPADSDFISKFNISKANDDDGFEVESNSATLGIDEEMNDEALNDLPKDEQPNNKSTECPICHKSFKNSSGLKRHAYVHKEKTCKCDVCDKMFGTKSNLDRHKKIHLVNRETYPCDICQKEFQTKESLKRHANVHDLSREVLECGICQKKFISSNGLKGHIRRMHQDC